MADERGTLQTIFHKFWILVVMGKGLGLFQCRRDGEKLAREEGLLIRISCISLVIVSSLVNIYQIQYFAKHLHDNYELGEIFNPHFLVALRFTENVIIAAINVYRQFTNAQIGIQIIESLTKYDRKVKQMGVPRKDNFLFTWLLLVVPTVSCMLMEFFGMISVITFWTGYIINPILIILSIVNQLARLKFCMIGHLLYQRYKHLNEIVLPKDKWRLQGNMATNRRFVHIHDLVYLHSTLTGATEMMAEVYSFELFVWIMSPIWQFLLGVKLIQIWKTPVSGIWGCVEAFRAFTGLGNLCWLCHVIPAEATDFAMWIITTDPELIHSANINEEVQAGFYLNQHSGISFECWYFFKITLQTFVWIATLTLNLGLVVFDGEHEIKPY